MQQMGMDVKDKIITAFSSVDTENIHVAIAAEVAAELWKRHPNIHFQTTGPAKGKRLPGEPHPITAAAVTFKFAKTVLYCNKMQDLNHIGTIQIDRGVCTVTVTDPASSSYNNKVNLLERQWPLEFPGFPKVLYDELEPILSETAGDPKEPAAAVEYLYEVQLKKSGKHDKNRTSIPLRHLTERYDVDPIRTLCGQKVPRSNVQNIKQSIDFTRDGKYCANCRESRIFKRRRGEL